MPNYKLIVIQKLQILKSSSNVMEFLFKVILIQTLMIIQLLMTVIKPQKKLSTMQLILLRNNWNNQYVLMKTIKISFSYLWLWLKVNQKFQLKFLPDCHIEFKETNIKDNYIMSVQGVGYVFE
ncbi:unnamed protein product [Paramecium sonneborni]|uniref:Transmembrane protein n=1 Tax=Paramecium sonneborni TaxID=65129 RepID=A0A8S1QYQ3_9CILI|nr:unnamed protein product [Paramecium sonneborni]